MDRTQHKCFLASAILHGVLLATVVVVSAFSKPPPDLPKTVLTYVPINAKDLPGTPPSGPTATDVPPTPPQPVPPPPPPLPPPPQATKIETKLPPPVKDDIAPKKPTPIKDKGLLAPKPEAKPKPTPKDVAKKPATPKADKAEPKKPDPKKDEPKIKIASTDKLITKNPPKETDTKSRPPDSDGNKRAEQYAKLRSDWEKKLQGTLGGLKSDLSSPITIETPGAGAAAFSSYGAEIVTRYERNWLVPADAIEDNAVVQIVVTIARDGHVLDARVIRPCGRAVVDKSVRETLQRVRVFPPFPPGSTDEQRTFNVDFNLKAKRSTG